MADSLKDVDSQLDEAYSLAADRKDYIGALSMCETIAQDHLQLMAPLRKKAQIYAHKADFKQAIDEISEVMKKGQAEPGDYFFRGWWNLEDSNASDALKDLTKSIELGTQLGDDYFTESAYFFRSVANLQQGRYEDALTDSDHVRDDFLIYLRSGQVSKATIVSEAKLKS
jgi:tetratricopeptide (TPR) repeat protein